MMRADELRELADRIGSLTPITNDDFCVLDDAECALREVATTAASRDALTVQNDVLRNALRTMLDVMERSDIDREDCEPVASDDWDAAMAEARRLVG